MTNSPNSDSERGSASFDLLSEPVRRWVWRQEWEQLRDIQERAIPVLVGSDVDIIIAAATAGGKTEAAFLPIISRIAGMTSHGFKALYISPLKALINDQFGRLDDLCSAVELPVHRWHGDVSTWAKANARRNPGGVVLITPESLEALFVRRGFEVSNLFQALQVIVVDELHAFIGSERGMQVQSLLHRLEVALGRTVRRVGLSATLGDMRLAAEFLRPGRGETVVILESKAEGQNLKLQLRGYERVEKARGPKGSSDEAAEDVAYMQDIARHIFDKLHGSHSLIFAGSRQNVELYADLLRRQSEELALPEEFFPHHSNLSRAHREFVESRLRECSVPATAVCTSTLELGIDIGAIESVAEIGAPWSVASLRQRLGRSGRRPNQPSVIGIYIVERKWRPDLHPADALRCELVQAIAMVNLLVKGWCEPPRLDAYHLSTLVHQVLALIAQYQGIAASRAYAILIREGPFRVVPPDLFAEVLRAIGAPKAGLIEQSPDSTLLLADVGERIVNHHEFYAVFKTPQEHRIIHDGTELGTLPILTVLEPDMTIIFSGRRWKVVEVHDRQRTISVVPARAGRPPRFGGGSGDLHETVVAEMRRIYETTEVPAFLDATAHNLLAEARLAYQAFDLSKRCIFELDGDTFVFPWAGTIACATLALALKDFDLAASARGMIVEIESTPVETVRPALEQLAAGAAPDPLRLAARIANLHREKYDRFLPRSVLMQGVAKDRLAPETVPTLARLICSN